jgi:hypothetical protein
MKRPPEFSSSSFDQSRRVRASSSQGYGTVGEPQEAIALRDRVCPGGALRCRLGRSGRQLRPLPRWIRKPALMRERYNPDVLPELSVRTRDGASYVFTQYGMNRITVVRNIKFAMDWAC